MGAAPAAADRRRILLVDDVELNRVLTEAVLRYATYEVDCVGDSSAALAALESKSYDLVLMDLDMPGLGGHETAVAIRKGERVQAERRNVKVAALSSRRSVDARLRSRAVGMSAHIGRPIAANELLREVAEVLEPKVECSDPWDRQLFDDWVMRLGADRMEGFLAKLCDQFRVLLGTLLDIDATDDLHRKAHDAASTAGMLGFMEVTRRCRAVLEAGDAASEKNARPALVDALECAILCLDNHLTSHGQTAVAA